MQKEFQGAQSLANTKLVAMQEANEKRWEKQLGEPADERGFEII